MPINAGADVNALNTGRNPIMHEAVWRGHTGTVWLLSGAGADVSAKTADGSSLLLEARWRGHAELERILMDGDAR